MGRLKRTGAESFEDRNDNDNGNANDENDFLNFSRFGKPALPSSISNVVKESPALMQSRPIRRFISWNYLRQHLMGKRNGQILSNVRIRRNGQRLSNVRIKRNGQRLSNVRL